MLSVGLRFVAAITIAASTIVSTSPAVELDQLPIALPEPSPATSARKAQPIDGDDTTGFAAKTEARAQAAQSGSRLAYDRERVLADVRDHLEARRLAEALAVPRSQRPHLRSEAAVSAYMRLRELNGASLDLAWNPETSTPRYIAGPNLPAGAPGRPALSASAAFLDEVGPLLRLEHPRAELAVTRVVDAADGSSAIRYAQIVDEMPVWGRDLIVRFDAAGAVVGLSAQTIPTTRPVRGPIDEAAAQEYARVSLSPDAIVEDSQAVVLPVEGGAIAAWRVRVAAGLSAREDVFVRTDHLAIEKRETLVYHGGGAATGSGVDLAGVTQTLQLYQIDGTYFLINTTKDMFDAGGSDLPQEGKGVIYLLDAQNGEGDQLFFATAGSPTGWAGQENAVSASAYASIVYDYFRSVHNRLSIDDAGMNMNLVVNFGSNFGNAFWNGQFMVFGNGDGSNFSDLAGSLDVTAHEMSHGVIEHTANLVYEFEPGALNEHFADVFGVATDFHHNGGAANWLLGEDVTTPSIAGDCLRNMAEPDAANVAFNGQQPAHMNDFRDLPIDVDNGGVHINSGIPNRAFFLASTDAGMSVSKAEAIWYRALSQYLNRNSQFADFRIAIRQAAADLHGAGSAEQISVTDALNAVGMTDETDTDDPQDLPDNDGADFLAAIGAGDDLIYRTPLTTLEFTPISAGVSVALSGRPAFSDDGQLMTFVGGDQNVYFGGSDGSNVAAISSGGEFWSVALSADGRLLAATPLQEDNAIFVFDLVNPDNSAAYELTTQTSGDSAEDDIAFADVIEFGVGQDFLVYDALHEITLGGEPASYWDINFLRLADGLSFRVFQPLPPDQSIGNPTFAQNSDNKLAFDFLGPDGNVLVMAADIVNGVAGQVTNNFQSLGRPTFSGDDGTIYYEFTSGQSQIWQVTLAADGLTGSGDDTGIISDGYWPVHFTEGQRTTPILVEALSGSWENGRATLTWFGGDAFTHYDVERSLDDGAFSLRTPTPVPAEELVAGSGRFSWSEDVAAAGSRATYRLSGYDASGSRVELVSITVSRAGALPAAVLLPPTPNPARAAVRLRFQLPDLGDAAIELDVFDVRGRRVASPIAGHALQAGAHDVAWEGRTEDGRPLPAGEYVVRLTAGDTVQSRKVVLVR